MTCKHTGADVYLESHGAVLHCDIHTIGNVAVLRISDVEHVAAYDPSRHYLLADNQSTQWHDQRAEYSTLIALHAALTVPESERDRWF